MAEMHTTLIRLDADLWRLIKADAERRNVSAAEWLRTAAAMRIGFEAAAAGDELVREVVEGALAGEEDAASRGSEGAA